MLKHLLTYSLYIAGLFLLFRCVMWIFFYTKYSNVELPEQTDSKQALCNPNDILKEEKKRMSKKRGEILHPFFDSIRSLLDQNSFVHIDVKEITESRNETNKQLMELKEPILSYNESLEIRQIMDTVDEICFVVQDFRKTRRPFKQSKLKEIFLNLTESLKGYDLSNSYGSWAEEEYYKNLYESLKPDLEKEEKALAACDPY
jgi:hypothetical protein